MISVKYDKQMYYVLGSHLRSIREKNDKSLEEVAGAVGLTKKTIQRYEMGESRITVNTLKEICRYLKVDYDQFSFIVNKEIENKKKLKFIDCCFEFAGLNPDDYEDIEKMEKEILDIVPIITKKYKKP